MTYVGTGFGAEQWGGGPWGGLPTYTFAPSLTFVLNEVVALRENMVELTFSSAISLTGILDIYDGTRPFLYTISPVSGTFGRDGSPARPVTVALVQPGPLATQVDLWLDRPLAPAPSQYTISITGLYDINDNPQHTVLSAGFVGLYRGIAPALSELVTPSRDFANPQTLSSLLDPLPNTTDPTQLGTFPIDESGDVAYDEGLASYKKRIFRRLMTQLGAYAQLPDYGVTIKQHVKQLGRPGLIQKLGAEAEAQIRQEPETQDCSVVIVQEGPIVYYRIAIRTSAGQQVQMIAPIQP